MKHIRVAILLMLVAFSATAGTKDPLRECWNKQTKPLGHSYLNFNYEEKLNELYHSAEPWEQHHYTGGGTIWCNAIFFFKQDSINSGRRTYYSKTRMDKKELLFLDYGNKDQSSITKSMIQNKLIETARYTPITLLEYFVNHKSIPDKESNTEFSVYKTTINKTVTRLYIRNADKQVEKITTLENDDLRGDVLSTFYYRDYTSAGSLPYPKTILIEKFNGRVKDEVHILNASITITAPAVLEKPADYKIEDDKVVKQELKTTKYSEHIHFVDLMPTGSRVMVVEFSDFLLVSEAPLNSENGEMIISEVQKIAPGKQIRYFTFSHHHPDYIGGIRPFIHKGAAILGVKEDNDYINFLANAPHTIIPDSLQLQPRALKWETITDSTIISDGRYNMNIYHIGKKSGHTADYLVFYFPQEKLLVEGDLIWIKDEGVIEKASEMQAGVYQAIKDLHIDVKTIVQSWGIAFKGYKFIIPFDDLEKSVNVK